VNHNALAPAGDLGLLVLDRDTWGRRWPGADRFRPILEHGLPAVGADPEVNRWRRSNLPNLWRGARRVAAAKAFGVPTHYGALWGRIIRGDGTTVDLGLMSLRVVTTVGVGYIVDAFQNLVEAENMRFHGFGTGTTAEAVGNTALVTELTTQYNPDNTRPTGTQTEAAANIYRNVATLSPDSGGTIAVTEHGVFSAATGGVLLDRSVFSAVNLVAGTDSLQTTYDLTFTAGG